MVRLFTFSQIQFQVILFEKDDRQNEGHFATIEIYPYLLKTQWRLCPQNDPHFAYRKGSMTL